jgi:DNA-binding response OmpR family regulator
VNRTLLMVDDNAEILTAAHVYLTQRGFDVVIASSALGVSSLVLRHKPDLIILDVMMPALDGGALAKLVRQVGSGHDVPIVFFSSMEEEQLYRLARETDGASYVLKSDGLEALHACVCRRLGEPRG